MSHRSDSLESSAASQSNHRRVTAQYVLARLERERLRRMARRRPRAIVGVLQYWLGGSQAKGESRGQR